MENIRTEKIFLIIIFYVLAPSLDQYTDINMARRLFRGPEDEVQIVSGKNIVPICILALNYHTLEHNTTGTLQFTLGHGHGDMELNINLQYLKLQFSISHPSRYLMDLSQTRV